jgi:cytochrome c551/c552
MRKNFLIIFMAGSLIIGSSSLSGCYYDVEEELYGFCDSTNVTYSTTINNIVNSYGCVGCHSGAGASGGVVLNTYTGIKSKVTDGRLMGSINHVAGFSPMPQGGAKMSQCDINKIQAWVAAGAPNN